MGNIGYSLTQSPMCHAVRDHGWKRKQEARGALRGKYVLSFWQLLIDRSLPYNLVKFWARLRLT